MFLKKIPLLVVAFFVIATLGAFVFWQCEAHLEQRDWQMYQHKDWGFSLIYPPFYYGIGNKIHEKIVSSFRFSSPSGTARENIFFTEKTKEYTNQHENYTITMTYPELTNFSNSNATEMVNREIITVLEDAIKNYEKVINDWNNQAVLKSEKGYEIKTWFTPHILTDSFVSIEFRMTLDSFGQFKTWRRFIPFVYDVGAGRQILLEQFFRKGSQYQVIISKLIAVEVEKIYPDATKIFASYLTPEEKNFQQFVPTESGLLFHFDVFGAGSTQITIPWKSLEGILDPKREHYFFE
ncbi:MAG: hypothetical protein HYV41_01490 [Candidatus Magasanikbacteria bacterium]|nr:hypothetical protein [Candidatus Magasanikbacteria bacterium]